MKATIKGSGPKKADELVPQEGHWYWCMSAGRTWLCICARVDYDMFAFICAENGCRWIDGAPTLMRLGQSGMEGGGSFVPATVTINAE